MTLDGAVRISDRDEAARSEMMVHVPAMEMPFFPRRFLILGGVGGGVAEECLKYLKAEVEMCEIDARVIELCRENFRHVHRGAFDNPRLTLHRAAAADFLSDPSTRGRFDVIIADWPDSCAAGSCTAAPLDGGAFCRLVNDALSEQGVATFQSGVPFYRPQKLSEALSRLAGVFPRSGVYLTAVPTCAGGYTALTWGSKGTTLGTAETFRLSGAWLQTGIETEHYAPALHVAAFALPRWMQKLLPNA